MDKKNCSVCSQDYEVCKNCEKYGRMKGCVVEDKEQGWHDNGGYVEDPNDNGISNLNISTLIFKY